MLVRRVLAIQSRVFGPFQISLSVRIRYLLQKIAWCTPCLAVLWTAEAVVHSVQMMRVDLPVCVGGPGSEDGARECCRCSLRFATYISPPVSFKNSALVARFPLAARLRLVGDEELWRVHAERDDGQRDAADCGGGGDGDVVARLSLALPS